MYTDKLKKPYIYALFTLNKDLNTSQFLIFSKMCSFPHAGNNINHDFYKMLSLLVVHVPTILFSILTHHVYIANGYKKCYIMQQFTEQLA